MENNDFGLFCTGYVSEIGKDHLHYGGPVYYILGVHHNLANFQDILILFVAITIYLRSEKQWS